MSWPSGPDAKAVVGGGPAPKANLFFTRFKASTLLQVLEASLAKKKIGRISDGHELALLVRELRRSFAGYCLPKEGESSWAKLSASTGRESSRGKSSARSLALGRDFCDWLRMT